MSDGFDNCIWELIQSFIRNEVGTFQTSGTYISETTSIIDEPSTISDSLGVNGASNNTSIGLFLLIILLAILVYRQYGHKLKEVNEASSPFNNGRHNNYDPDTGSVN